MPLVSLLALLMAQPLLEERFERPLTAPWAVSNLTPQSALAVTAGSAHWGDGGLAFSRFDGGTAAGFATNVVLAQAPATPPAGDLHVRFWFRLEAGTSQLRISPLQVGQPIDAFTLGELYVDEGGSGALVLSCADQGFRRLSLPGQVVPGRWHLLELDLEGLGTDDGGCRGAIDGQEAALTGFAWHQRAVALILSGFNVVDDRWVGRYAIDDLTLTHEPLAMRAVLSGPEVVDAGGCVALQVAFEGRDGGPMPPPSTTRLRLVVDGGALFADPACRRPLELEVAPADLTALHVQPDTSAVNVELSSNDLLGSSWASGPPPPRTRDLAVGCGCTGAPGGLALGGLLALLGRARRRPK
jgi:uncharacterized protein (TIGR03382 family)